MTAPASLVSTDHGSPVAIYDATPGMYAWHAGAFRRIDAVLPHSIKFAGVRRHLHFDSPCHTLEVAP